MGWLLDRKPYYKYSEDYTQISDVDINNSCNGFIPEAPINLFGTPYFFYT